MRVKRRTLAIAVLVLAIAVFTGAAFTWSILLRDDEPDDEPRYQGKRLSEWLALCRVPAVTNEELQGEAEFAVRSIGTNALPCLLKWFRYELPPWRGRILELATWHLDKAEGKKVVFRRSFIIGPTARRAEKADLGFVILNTNAAPATAELEALMKNSRKPDVGLRAIYALGEIGGPAIPALTNALADANQTNRCEIIHAIYVVELMSPYYYGGSYRGGCLPALNRALDDPDEEVRRQAKNTLYNLSLDDITRFNLHGRIRTSQPLTNVPAK